VVDVQNQLGHALGSPSSQVSSPEVVIALVLLASQDLAGTCYQPPTSAIIGTNRSEKLVGTKGDDIILGKGGNDRI
jgi:hypothetical protein